MALSNFKIRLVMRRRDLEHTSTKLWIDCLVSNDWDLDTGKRTPTMFTNEMPVPLVVRIYRDSGIPHQGLRTGSSDLEKPARFLNHFVPHDIQSSRDRGRYHFLIGQRGERSRAPIHHPLTAIDEPFIVEIHEDSTNLPGILLVHGKPFP